MLKFHKFSAKIKNTQKFPELEKKNILINEQTNRLECADSGLYF